jgi:serine protease Do
MMKVMVGWAARRIPIAVLLVLFGLRIATSFAQETAPAAVPPAIDVARVLEKQTPETLEELLAIEERIQEHLQKMVEATVCVTVGQAQGSGVVINQEGYVMTAAHVIGRPGLPAMITFSDGSRARAETLGVDERTDAGVVRIVEEGEWTFCQLAEETPRKAGEWCVVTGHPGGYVHNRPPVMRVGRVISVKDAMVQTDCTLVGGDSGGPLYNLDGQVIGINSRIGASTAWNFHVPALVFQRDWDKLSSPAGFLGVGGNPSSLEGPCILTTIQRGGPGEKAGLQTGDVILQFDGKKIDRFLTLVEVVARYRPEQKILLKIKRGEEILEMEVVLGRKDPYAT